MEKRVRDITSFVDVEHLADSLKPVLADFEKSLSKLNNFKPRSNESFVMERISIRLCKDFNNLINSIPHSIEGIALSTRNIFEVSLILKYILQSKENMNEWLGQLANDEKQILEGFLNINGTKDPKDRSAIEARIEKLKEICYRHNIQLSKQFNIRDVAKNVGHEDDYISFYKFFSKYVHPTSWLINKPEKEIGDTVYQNAFVMNAQLYFAQSKALLGDWLKEKTANPVVENYLKMRGLRTKDLLR